MSNTHCFACNKALKASRYLMITEDGQVELVGADCYKKIKINHYNGGYQPPGVSPKLFLMKNSKLINGIWTGERQ